MKVSYYPGCSLRGTAREYDESIRDVCQALGIELAELDDWSCCGASSAHSTNDFLSVALPARNLTLAEKQGPDLVVPCSACYQRLKVAEKRLAQTPLPDFPYQGKVKVQHLLNFCSREEVAGRIKEKVKRPLSGLKVACYYGCLIARPPKVVDAVDYEDPREMDRLVESLEAEPVNWSYKTECCGGSLVLSLPGAARKMSQKLLDMAREAGADCLATCCPLCQSNLDTCQGQLAAQTGISYSIPVFYFTELMGLALGLPAPWLKRHLVSPARVLSVMGAT